MKTASSGFTGLQQLRIADATEYLNALNRLYDVDIGLEDYDVHLGNESHAVFGADLLRIDFEDTQDVRFVLRHEFAHAAFGSDEIDADRFAAERAAIEGEPLEQLGIDLLGTPEDYDEGGFHPSGERRIELMTEAYQQVLATGRGKYV
jgi:hypothetical protein